jgi:hypothetical protein
MTTVARSATSCAKAMSCNAYATATYPTGTSCVHIAKAEHSSSQATQSSTSTLTTTKSSMIGANIVPVKDAPTAKSTHANTKAAQHHTI